MSYSASFQPGMEDLNPDLTVKNRSLLRYCEDTAGFHTDSLGDGLLQLNSTGQAWILMAWYMEVFKRPQYGDTLTVATWPRQMAKVHAWRDFRICDGEGSLLAEATSKWIVVEGENHRVVRIPERMRMLYPEEPGGALSQWRPERVTLPVNRGRKAEVIIPRSRTDLLGHMHNLCYLDLAEDALPEKIGQPGSFPHVSMVFKSELKAGEKAVCSCEQVDGQFRITLCHDDDLCAQVCLW
ncbi:MAG: thioesterase [Oscillospiraceae bacterium]|nr:thioesterase [Oscillospiraceae bacterium]